jgi:hypothetical protein
VRLLRVCDQILSHAPPRDKRPPAIGDSCEKRIIMGARDDICHFFVRQTACNNESK